MVPSWKLTWPCLGAVQAQATNFTMMHNAALTDMTSTFNSSMDGAMVYNYDTASFFSNLLTMATAVRATLFLLHAPTYDSCTECSEKQPWVEV